MDEAKGKRFIYHTTVTIGDTNLLQNMYFSNFFKIQGAVRELWMMEHVENAMQSMQDGLVLITRTASCKYHRDFYLYDRIRVELQFTNIRNTGADLIFRFYKGETDDLHAEGHQQIVLADSNHKVCRKMPENFLKAVKEYSAEM